MKKWFAREESIKWLPGDVEDAVKLFKCYLKSFSMRLIITHMLSPCPPDSICLFLLQASIKQFLSFGQWAYFNDGYFVI